MNLKFGVICKKSVSKISVKFKFNFFSSWNNCNIKLQNTTDDEKNTK